MCIDAKTCKDKLRKTYCKCQGLSLIKHFDKAKITKCITKDIVRINSDFKYITFHFCTKL